MISTLRISNFKSIQSLGIDCRKINVFIGPPNVGKSNILESLGIFCLPFIAPSDAGKILRYEHLINLFYDEDSSRTVEIRAGNYFCAIKLDANQVVGSINDRFHFSGQLQAGSSIGFRGGVGQEEVFRYYRFLPSANFPSKEYEFLIPPDGKNLLFLLQTNKQLQRFAGDLFKAQGYRLVLKPQTSQIEIQKEAGDVVIAYPYSLASDTLQRLIFHFAAIESNQKSILILEEPESHAFPLYTKLLAERIALDTAGNQYFLSTHNPYFLLPLVSKTPMSELAVYIVKLEQFQTRAYRLADDGLRRLLDLDADVFFNFDRLLAGVS